ncbi:DUF6445 family protein [Sphingomonas silueang]|uniref:DUF6445 family protein n=1 Tax=Sphingomonas silueang TaxID=3156617 RepID=UPI0032B4B23E
MTAACDTMDAAVVPLWIVDDAHPAPDALVAAARATPFARRDRDMYPGVRAAVPPDYAGWLSATAADVIGTAGRVAVCDVTFASVTEDPAGLAPIQHIPHFDTADPSICAAVHYLCHPPHRGTAFYRHERTGLQRIDPASAARWPAELARDARHHGLPDRRYADGSTPAFAQVRAIDLGFNRMILYPANCLHSGLVHQHRFGEAPATGRLTITSLMQLSFPL